MSTEKSSRVTARSRVLIASSPEFPNSLVQVSPESPRGLNSSNERGKLIHFGPFLFEAAWSMDCFVNDRIA